MGDSSPVTPPLSDSSVLEVSGKIAIAAVIVLFIVVTFIFLLDLYARWFWSLNEDPSIVSWRRQLASQNQPSTAVPRQRGLSSSTLRSLPVVVYNLKDFEDGLECAVCLSELREGEKARMLPNCNHGFHVDCIDLWFCSHSTCPICRTLVASAEPNSNSDSDSDSNSSSSFHSISTESSTNEDSNASEHSVESPVFPTNVLFWGDETQVRSLELCSEEGQGLSQAANAGLAASSASSSSSGNIGRPGERLVIDIPMPCEICSPLSSPSTARLGAEGEAKSPVLTRLRSLKRLLSRGNRVAPSPCSSSSVPGAFEQV